MATRAGQTPLSEPGRRFDVLYEFIVIGYLGNAEDESHAVLLEVIRFRDAFGVCND